MAGIVVVFDFDKTIIDCDSDNWVIDGLGATQLFEELLPTMPWNSLMDRMMRELHSQGKTIADIEECLKRAPLYPATISAIKSAHALGCDLRIVSDANLFFIETILKHHGLIECFSEINTNPSFVDEDGKLGIFPYHDFTSSPHGCTCIHCPPNMCKGLIIERIRASVLKNEKKRFIYLGDGKGDFCPSLKLEEGDHVMPRRNYPVWDLICNNPLLLKAEIHEWSNAEDLETVLLNLIKEISSVDDGNSNEGLLSIDCKFQTIPIASHEALPKALPIRH
ncbi:Inorganic pyrophosphatase 1 [Asimina triloba]